MEAGGDRECGDGLYSQRFCAGAGERCGRRQAAFQNRPACCGTGFFSPLSCMRACTAGQWMPRISCSGRAPLVTLPLARHCRAMGQKMVSRDCKLSMRKQCTLLQLSRSRLYYQPVGESAENLRFMEIIDKQFLETPWYGSRQMARYMKRNNHQCGRHRVRRLMRLMRLVPTHCPAGYRIAMHERGSGAQHKQEASTA